MRKTLLFSVAAFALCVGAAPVMAQDAVVVTETIAPQSQTVVAVEAETVPVAPVVTGTVVTQTTASTVADPDATQINFMDFDLNGDLVLTREEVGKQLFYLFDTDGNEVIDNVEFDNENVITMSPVVLERTVLVDFNGDGIVDAGDYTVDSFMAHTNLSAFNDGDSRLSAKNFIEAGFLNTDVNDDTVIDINEFQDAYIASLAPLSANQEIYNQ